MAGGILNGDADGEMDINDAMEALLNARRSGKKHARGCTDAPLSVASSRFTARSRTISRDLAGVPDAIVKKAKEQIDAAADAKAAAANLKAALENAGESKAMSYIRSGKGVEGMVGTAMHLMAQVRAKSAPARPPSLPSFPPPALW